jgi:hypothetical protein
MGAAPQSLAECHLLVAVPLYDGAQGPFLRSLLALTGVARARELKLSVALLTHQPSINRARNSLMTSFHDGSYTHMLFVDGDIGFNADEVIGLVEAMLADQARAIIGAPCPKRLINWRTVAAAVQKGAAQDNPAELEKFAGDFAFELLDSDAQIALDRPVELAKLGTGLMLIRRDVAEVLRAAHPEFEYRPNPVERPASGLGETAHAFFQPMIEADTQKLLSDDYAFCRRARDAGFRIWLAPWMRVTHTGPATFSGSLVDLARLFPSSRPE